jgi:hypothetical protein
VKTHVKERQSKPIMPQWVRLPFGVGMILVVMLAFSAKAEIYSWTDDKGVRHFSDNPPQYAANVQIEAEIPHDKTADQQHDDAYRQMMKDIAAQQQREEEAAEKEALLKRLDAAERRSTAAQQKAEAALKAAEEAQAAASEKQRYREVYVFPRWTVGPRVPNNSGGISGRESYPNLPQLLQ